MTSPPPAPSHPSMSPLLPPLVSPLVHRLARGLALLAGLALAAPSEALTGGTASADYPHLGIVGGSVDGILVAPQWVLTAAHVARSSVQFHSGFGSALIDAAYVAPGADFPGNDLALLHLATPLASTQFPTLSSVVLSGPAAVGYGEVTAAAASAGGSYQYAYSVLQDAFETAEIDGGGLYTVYYLSVGPAAGGSALLQGGDSGGALFSGAADDSSGLLLGIASATDGRDSYFVQPAAYREWLDATVASSGQRLLWDDVSPVPEPAAAGLWLAGLGVLGAFAACRRLT